MTMIPTFVGLVPVHGNTIEQERRFSCHHSPCRGLRLPELLSISLVATAVHVELWTMLSSKTRDPVQLHARCVRQVVSACLAVGRSISGFHTYQLRILCLLRMPNFILSFLIKVNWHLCTA